MADTKPDVVVPKGIWTDLYLGSTITAGTAVDIYNKGNGGCMIAAKSTIPTGTYGIPLPVGGHLSVTAGYSGLWALSPDIAVKICVQD